MNWSKVLKLSIAITAAVASFNASAGSKDVAVSVNVDKQSLQANDDVFVTVNITNTSAKPQYVLKWHTPFGKIEEGLFEVTRDGVKLPYLGAHIKRPAPTQADYFLLAPGKSYTAKIELSSMYDMSVTGDYSVRYSAHSLNLFINEHANGFSADTDIGALESTAAVMWINGRNPRGFVAPEPIDISALRAATTSSLAFSGCSSTQQNTITSAIGAAKTMANSGVNYMAAGNAGQRYTKWFGAYTSSRFSTVKSHYGAIKTAFDSKPVTVDCGCKESYYAYVYPTQPYKIYVCNAFWKAPLTGTDSKGGTLVHEMSHFNVVASTDDWVYGQSGAASLAISNPTKAIDNADSHEYFAENSPSLP